MRKKSSHDFRTLGPCRPNPPRASLCAHETVDCWYIYLRSALLGRWRSTLQLEEPRYCQWVQIPGNDLRVLQCNE
jgi:hypothetical protein